MKTFETIEAARTEAGIMNKIIKINHRDNGECYIIAKCPMTVLASALRKNPMPEIVELISEHLKETAEEIKKIKADAKAEWEASAEYEYKQHVNKINNAMTLNGSSM